jgi:hypothetical protein
VELYLHSPIRLHDVVLHLAYKGHAFMELYLIKYRNNFTFTLYFLNEAMGESITPEGTVKSAHNRAQRGLKCLHFRQVSI